MPTISFLRSRARFLATVLSVSSFSACASDSKANGGGRAGGPLESGDGDLSSDENPGTGVDTDSDDGTGNDQGPDACADVETTPVRTIPSVVFLVDYVAKASPHYYLAPRS
jgi:hypothetical protein